MFPSRLLVLITVAASYAYGWSSLNSSPSSRRDLFHSVVASTGGIAFVVTTFVPPVEAMSDCPRGSKNCIRTTWTAPPGTQDVPKALGSILESYPQGGQADVDLGGWTIAEGNLLSGDTTARYEYSSGIGKFAKFFNGGKPFIDDLAVEIDGTTVEIRSSSRVGDSDFDVNKLRLLYLGNKAKDLGWTVPDPKY